MRLRCKSPCWTIWMRVLFARRIAASATTSPREPADAPGRPPLTRRCQRPPKLSCWRHIATVRRTNISARGSAVPSASTAVSPHRPFQGQPERSAACCTPKPLREPIQLCPLSSRCNTTNAQRSVHRFRKAKYSLTGSVHRVQRCPTGTFHTSHRSKYDPSMFASPHAH